MEHTPQPTEKILLEIRPPRRAFWYWAIYWSLWSETILISSFIMVCLGIARHRDLDFEFFQKFLNIRPGFNVGTVIFSLKMFLIFLLTSLLLSKILTSRYYIMITNQRVLTRRGLLSVERNILFEEIMDIRTEPYAFALEKWFKLKSIDINNSKSCYLFRTLQTIFQKKFCRLDGLTPEQYKAILEILLPKIQIFKTAKLKENTCY